MQAKEGRKTNEGCTSKWVTIVGSYASVLLEASEILHLTSQNCPPKDHLAINSYPSLFEGYSETFLNSPELLACTVHRQDTLRWSENILWQKEPDAWGRKSSVRSGATHQRCRWPSRGWEMLMRLQPWCPLQQVPEFHQMLSYAHSRELCFPNEYSNILSFYAVT